MARFSLPQDPVFQQLNASLAIDWRLGPYDVEQSRAHAKMLAEAGIISEHDRDELLSGLERVEAELEAGSFPFRTDDEDIHMAIERRLTEIAGPVGGRLHTARSRNDQVATDVAMFTRAHALTTVQRLGHLQSTIVQLADRHLDWAMPGYTHLQRAQPVYLAHHLLAYFWMFRRDARRFENVLGETSDLPLGAGALAGVNFETDRGLVARELGFAGVAPNSIDAVSNRDFVLDYLSAAAICATHLSRLGAEIVLWSSQEFGFCEVSDAWASGSSIMPQKKNPDAAELLRAKAPRVVGHLAALHGVLHGLPLTYNKDMQEDKEHLFDAADTLDLCLQAATGMLSSLSFDRERLAGAAVDVADMLVRRGVPFRQAHGIVAALVREAVDSGRTLSELTREELTHHSEALDDEYYSVLAARSWLESKVSEGGTASSRVREQLAHARAELDGQPA
jgi:argininosuccinate lyase